MKEKTLSIFVDESGKLQYPDPTSRFYMLGMVLHDQSEDISDLIRDLDHANDEIGMDPERFVFHTGPLIRAEKGYSMFSRHMRGRLFRRMMTFARKAPFRYHCLCVDKKYIDSALQVITRLKSQLKEFLSSHKNELADVAVVKVYYDCGQAPVTNLLHEALASSLECRVEFVQGVKPERYKLFQLADLICTISLIEHKLEVGDPMTNSEYSFFGGRRAFKHNVLAVLRPKLI